MSGSLGEDEGFNRLVRWMEANHPGYESNVVCRNVPGAGRGLFAARDLDPGETLLAIPASAMLNPLTLLASSPIPARLFPQTRSQPVPVHPKKKLKLDLDVSSPTRRLNTTQLLTLHLALARDKLGRYPSPWGRYLATLPAFRPWHPLTWLVGTPGVRWTALSKMLPKGTGSKLEDVLQRWEKDREVLSDVLREEDPFRRDDLVGAIDEEDMRWAWLNVNTRTLSIPLNLPSPTDLHNHTLCPLLDMINHSSDPAVIVPRPIQTSCPFSATAPFTRGGRGGDQLLVPGKIGFKVIAPARGIREGEELFFEYGGHSNATLFAEYGFCEMPPTQSKTAHNRDIEGILGAQELSSRGKGGTLTCAPLHGIFMAGISAARTDKNGGRKGKRKGKRRTIEANGHAAEEGGSRGLSAPFANLHDEGPSDDTAAETGWWLKGQHGEVVVNHLVDEFWRDTSRAAEKQRALEAIGCWRRNVLLTRPSPPHPSYSLQMTLRVLVLSDTEAAARLPAVSSGAVSFVSLANEEEAMRVLERICRGVMTNGEAGLQALRRLQTQTDETWPRIAGDPISEEDWQWDGAIRMVEALWREGMVIARAVQQRIANGDTGW